MQRTVRGIWTPGSYVSDNPLIPESHNAHVDALTKIFESARGQLLALSGGEFERTWLLEGTRRVFQKLSGVRAMRVAHGNTYASYAPRSVISAGRRRTVLRNLDLSGMPSLEITVPILRDEPRISEVLQRGKSPETPRQYSVASPNAWALFTGLWWLREQFIEAYRTELAEAEPALTRAPSLLCWELPVELSMVAWAPRSREYDLAQRLVEPIGELIDGTPPGTLHAFHLCRGNLGGNCVPGMSPCFALHQAKYDLVRALVNLNVWNKQKLFLLHDPDSPTTDTYDLPGLLPPETLYAASSLGRRSTRTSVVQAVNALPHTAHNVAIATSCGFGRDYTVNTMRAALTMGAEAVRTLQEG